MAWIVIPIWAEGPVFAQPRATPWGFRTTRCSPRPNGPTVRRAANGWSIGPIVHSCQIHPHGVALGLANGRPFGATSFFSLHSRLMENTVRNNPHVQVALTYLHWPLSSFLKACVTVGILCLMIGSVLSKEVEGFTLFLIGMVDLYLFLIMHIRRQFSNPYLHVIPGFRRVHLTVAAMATITAAVLLPMALFYWAGMLSVGHIAITVLVFSAVFWFLLNPLAPLTWLLGLGSLFLLSGWWPMALEQLYSGRSESLAFAILMFGAATIVLGGDRLGRLTEDSLEYPFGMEMIRGQGAGHHTTHVGILQRQIHNPLQERRMAGLIRHAQRASVSRWSRVCRWQVAMPVGVWTWCIILGAILFAQVMWWIIDDGTSQGPELLLLYISLFITFLPIVVIDVRISTINHELLFPINRTQYMKQLGAAMIFFHLQLWVGVMLALTLWAILVSWQWSTLLIIAVVLSAAFHGCAFGVAVWSAGFRSQPFGVFLGTLTVPIGVMVFACLQILQQEWLVIISVAMFLAMVGIMASYAAYRRWLVADLD